MAEEGTLVPTEIAQIGKAQLFLIMADGEAWIVWIVEVSEGSEVGEVVVVVVVVVVIGRGLEGWGTGKVGRGKGKLGRGMGRDGMGMPGISGRDKGEARVKVVIARKPTRVEMSMVMELRKFVLGCICGRKRSSPKL